jgi:hypothetical protein
LQHITRLAKAHLPIYSIVIIFFFSVAENNTLAQSTVKKDSISVKTADTTAILVANESTPIVVDSLAMLHSPQRAALLSAIIPGLGQVYNQKYWKVPIIYAGFGGIAIGIIRYNKFYQEMKFLYPMRVANPTAILHGYDPRRAPASAIKSARDYYRRNRDLFIIGAGLFYVLNIIDATVDGYFYEYDISNDLSLKISPVMLPSDRYATLGVSFSFNLN